MSTGGHRTSRHPCIAGAADWVVDLAVIGGNLAKAANIVSSPALGAYQAHVENPCVLHIPIECHMKTVIIVARWTTIKLPSDPEFLDMTRHVVTFELVAAEDPV